jgi:NADPH:quinone reductase-like Zn-dependent oxidoreductase
VLRYEDVDRPRPGPGEVLVQVAGTAFSPVDTWLRAGIIDQIFPVTFPHALGLDVAGTVVEQGEAVEVPAVGEAVIGFLPMTGPGAGRVVLIPVIRPRWRRLLVAIDRGSARAAEIAGLDAKDVDLVNPN